VELQSAKELKSNSNDEKKTTETESTPALVLGSKPPDKNMETTALSPQMGLRT
jgi:hypothetical protein